MRDLPVESVTIDGEAIIVLPSGHQDFIGLKSHDGASKAILMAFDLLEVDGHDLRREPIEHRRSRLSTLCGGAVMYSVGVEGEGPEVFEQACALGLEGIVSKAQGSVYRGGASHQWLKTLNPAYRRRSS